jgi:hypothetical protein
LGDFGLIVAEGTEDDGVRGRGMGAEGFEGCVDPAGEIGLAAPFEFKKAAGHGIGGGGQGKVLAKEEMTDLFVFIYYMCRLQPHPLSFLME